MACLQHDIRYVGVECGKSYYDRIRDQLPDLLLSNFSDKHLEQISDGHKDDVHDFLDSFTPATRSRSTGVSSSPSRALARLSRSPSSPSLASSKKRRKISLSPLYQRDSPGRYRPVGKHPRQVGQMAPSGMGKKPRVSYPVPPPISHSQEIQEVEQEEEEEEDDELIMNTGGQGDDFTDPLTF